MKTLTTQIHKLKNFMLLENKARDRVANPIGNLGDIDFPKEHDELQPQLRPYTVWDLTMLPKNFSTQNTQLQKICPVAHIALSPATD